MPHVSRTWVLTLLMLPVIEVDSVVGIGVHPGNLVGLFGDELAQTPGKLTHLQPRLVQELHQCKCGHGSTLPPVQTASSIASSGCVPGRRGRGEARKALLTFSTPAVRTPFLSRGSSTEESPGSHPNTVTNWAAAVVGC
jgi:hypothetical protein